MSNHKPRRPRWRPTGDVMLLAMHRAAKPPASDIEQVLDVLHAAHKALREGVATEQQWSVLAGCLDVALAIERQGVVRGLQEHLASAEKALQAVHDRANATATWRATPLHLGTESQYPWLQAPCPTGKGMWMPRGASSCRDGSRCRQ